MKVASYKPIFLIFKKFNKFCFYKFKLETTKIHLNIEYFFFFFNLWLISNWLVLPQSNCRGRLLHCLSIFAICCVLLNIKWIIVTHSWQILIIRTECFYLKIWQCYLKCILLYFCFDERIYPHSVLSWQQSVVEFLSSVLVLG